MSEIAIPKNLIDVLASLESGQLAMNTVWIGAEVGPSPN
jgi:hypothetical protein